MLTASISSANHHYALTFNSVFNTASPSPSPPCQWPWYAESQWTGLKRRLTSCAWVWPILPMISSLWGWQRQICPVSLLSPWRHPALSGYLDRGEYLTSSQHPSWLAARILWEVALLSSISRPTESLLQDIACPLQTHLAGSIVYWWMVQ